LWANAHLTFTYSGGFCLIHLQWRVFLFVGKRPQFIGGWRCDRSDFATPSTPPTGVMRARLSPPDPTGAMRARLSPPRPQHRGLPPPLHPLYAKFSLFIATFCRLFHIFSCLGKFFEITLLNKPSYLYLARI
jgi:hypothetical protein